MALQGIKKLPVLLEDKQALNLYKKLAIVNKVLGKLDDHPLLTLRFSVYCLTMSQYNRQE